MLNRRNFLGAMLAPSFLGSRSGGQPESSALPGPPFHSAAWPEESDPAYWDRIRDHFYFPRGEAFFNTGTIGAVPRPVLERMIEDMRTLQATVTRWDYTERTPNWISGYSPEVPLREKLGRLVNASGKDIAITQNATFGMNFVAHGFDLKSGDEVILTDQEHPGGIMGWQMRAKRDGIVVKQVRVPVPPEDPDEVVELFRQAITARTRVLAVPHLISASAIVLPVKRLCALAREHQALAVIDGAQAVGQIEVDLKDMGCDAYFSSPHKWLLAPPGNGMFYIRPEQQGSVWTTLCSSEWDNHREGLYRFMQYGTGNKSLQVGLDAALDFHFRVGPERWRARIRTLADRLRAGLQQIRGARISSPLHPELCGATVVYRVEGVPATKLEGDLWARKLIRVRSMGDLLGVRHSCHIYNSEAEIDATLEIVRDLAKKA
jgi:selenocysteine lyase/cysteine desulfurase